MNDMVHSLQIVGKTAVAAMLLILVSYVQAADETESSADDAKGLIQQSGHVEGFMRLPVADDEVDATFLAGRQGVDHGKILILHDAEQGIDSHGLVRTLRTGLADSGWSTMTVALTYPSSPQLFLSTQAVSATNTEQDGATEAEQEPSADNDAVTDTAQPDNDNTARVGAALAYLNAQQPGPTVLITIGEGATLTNVAVSQMQAPRGLVWIAPASTLAAAPEISPLLDIDAVPAGDKNLEAIKRKKLMKQSQHPAYDQRLMTGAGYHFAGFENRVLAYLRGWASKHFVTKDSN